MAVGEIVIVVGNGGREYELARQLALSPQLQKVYVAPGNAGTALLDKVENIALSPTDIPGIVGFIKGHNVHIAIIGPEAPLMAGLSDALREEGLAVFGASKAAAQLETSKAFAATFMTRHHIPQPNYWIAHTFEESLGIIKGKPADMLVIKADGLAGGKGVVLPATEEEAIATLKAMFSGEEYSGAGKETVVIQERLHGPEVSAFVISDGKRLTLLPFAQDHKRLQDGDKGPNTGGMGAYTPLPPHLLSDGQAAKIHTIAHQTIKGMSADSTPYQGVLYIGLMLASERDDDPVVIEYNARFGDPEAEVLLPAMSEAGVDIAAMLLQAANGQLPALPEKATPRCVMTVCLAAEGYPEHPQKGEVIEGLTAMYPHVIVQQAGTKAENGNIVTAGGRVLYVTGFGTSADQAAAHAYAAIGPDAIHFKGMQYRTDIGHQARSEKAKL